MARIIITEQNPLIARDFRQGRITPSAISEFLVPQNSVKDCLNVYFDTIVGSVVVRLGTTTTGTVASGKEPLGLAEFVGKGGTPNYMMAVFKGASNATAYYFDGTWHATNKTALSNTARDRFATLGGSVFMTNSSDGMFDSADGQTFGTTNSITAASPSITPSLVFRYNSRLLASGFATYPSRVYFSSIIDQSSSPFITWNTNASTGDWIDINPDDGGQVTGFSETSTFCLVFKGNGMYRLDTVNKSTDPENVFNIGAVSQEAITACQGIVYFFSGTDIRQTDGGFPQQISRAGVQDIVNAIPQSNWTKVAAGTDGLNVYFSLGDITLNANTENVRTITNCVLKFSPRDQSWTVLSYASKYYFYTLYTDSNGRLMRGADTGGIVQTINLGTTDNTAVISYFLTTQDMEFGNRSHLKSIGDKIQVFSLGAQASTMEAYQDGQVKALNIALTAPVSYSDPTTFDFHWFNLSWYGTSSGTAPVFGGFTIESVTDSGTTNK